ncbi:MAG: TIGR03667 family PPOX class F420-dependent oxidoreductase [Candidatus Tectomicrobia bacterium]|uniref:TIGR03667 family PPOX class F420-dependent oxidoreductase n=1 Tax=Tectimicrobiota bacterium TaxID=2528274 RepID=A0A932M0K3_UNCTE|nr:TIGR03667 family PPOX class F420-dependent oxidoreductase [Candidatus Tectomicrobia bacterium]
MLDFTTKFGRRVNRRLRQEQIIWLTTVDSNNVPLPRPVWFHWDGETLLIFSEEDRAKIRHIARNPKVSLNFNTDEEGGDVAVLVGKARVLEEPPPQTRVKAYLRKYKKGLKDLGMTSAAFTGSYSVPIVVTPKDMRGF